MNSNSNFNLFQGISLIQQCFGSCEKKKKKKKKRWYEFTPAASRCSIFVSKYRTTCRISRILNVIFVNPGEF